MIEFKVCLDPKGYTEKPVGDEIGRLNKRLACNVVTVKTGDELREFVKQVAEQGHTFCPATSKNQSRKQEDYEQSQLFPLDFDSGVSFYTIRSRAEKYNLPILFAYPTFGSNFETEKFRVVFLNDKSVAEPQKAKVIKTALANIFPEADKKCKDITHMYFGGKGGLHFNPKVPTINAEQVIHSMTQYLQVEHEPHHTKQRLEEFSRGTGLRLNRNGLPDVTAINNNAEYDSGTNDKNSPESIIIKDTNIIVSGENEIVPTMYSATGTDASAQVPVIAKANHALYRSADIGKLRQNCRLFREFEDGSRWLYHNELRGIAYSLIHVETGKAVFLSALSANKQHPSYVVKYKDFMSKWAYFKKNGYKPETCDNFCPHIGTCKHGTNILSCLRVKSNEMTKLANYSPQYYPIKKVEMDVKRKIKAAVNSADDDIHVVKGQVAVGKTEIYLNLMANADNRFMVGDPTNILKHDVYDRAIRKKIDAIETPSLLEVLQNNDDVPLDVQRHITNLYKSGNHKSVIPYIKETLKTENIPSLSQYLADLEEVRKSDGHIITTHRKLMTYDVETLNRYEVLVDEDIIFKSVMPNQEKVTISELKDFLKDDASDKSVTWKVRQILKRIETEKFFTVSEVDYDGDADTLVSFDVSALCKATKFCFLEKSKQMNISEDCIVFLKPVDFQNVKHTIVSATADETIYNYFFKDRTVHFHECKMAAYTGKLIQYYDKTMSRAYLREHLEIFDTLKNLYQGVPIITFQEFKDYVVGEKLHFGNTEGCDFYAGQDIIVVGTPHYPPFLYKLFAYTIGLDFDVNAKLKPNQLVKHNGYSFKFATFTEKALRDIQFWIIETELEQAVGRARLLRKPCTVRLFSNFPLAQANMRKWNWDNNAGENSTVSGKEKESCTI